MTLFPFIRLILLKLRGRRPPLGYVPYRYCSVKTQPWRPIVSARWYEERKADE
jgi:hypothetical protein